MASCDDFYVPSGAALRRAGVPGEAQFALGESKVQLFHSLGVQMQGGSVFSDKNRKRVENLIDLNGFFRFKDSELFRVFADCARLDETGGTGGGSRNDGTADLVFVVLGDRQCVVPVFDGDKAVRAELLTNYQIRIRR